ncbi:uncharacterized protein [Nicotiana tomentosiformis]|uniref:uncharacterized protein n=1 Tax=Nicotiana tomentosiformis TaxID=4098 RepID=UPI00388CBD25
MGSYLQGRHGGRFQQQRRPSCPRCGKTRLGICCMNLLICYRCGLRGHIQRDCRSFRQGAGSGPAHPPSSATTTSASPPPARGTLTPSGHGAARGRAHSSGGSGRLYVMRGRQNSEASPDLVICILTIQPHDMYALIDPGSTLSYVTPYVAMEFGIEPEQLHDPFFASTPVDESILAMQVYRDCFVTLCGQGTMADLMNWGWSMLM